MALKNLFLFILLAALWGGSFVAIKAAVTVIDPLMSAFLRLCIATMAICILFSIRKRSLSIPWRLLPQMYALGALSLALPFAFLFWGQTFISAGLAGLLNASVPLWTALIVFSSFSSDERTSLSQRTFFGLIIGFIGIFVLFSPLFVAQEMGQLGGAAAVLVGALLYAGGNVLTRYYLTRRADIGVPSLLFHQHIGALVLLGVLSFSLEPWSSDAWAAVLTPTVITSLLYLGVISTAFGLLIHFHLLREMGSVFTSAVTYVVPVFALSWDAAFNFRLPHPAEIAGMLIILGSIHFLRAKKA